VSGGARGAHFLGGSHTLARLTENDQIWRGNTWGE